MPASYYSRVLYPIQNKVIDLFRGSPFYLTGGTALSRGYYNHRYSDDLDYFVNDHPDFGRISERQIKKLGEVFGDLGIALKESRLVRLFVSPARLKIEMIDDVPAHAGKIVNHPSLGALDSKENILANKLTALIDRALPKDIADIFFLLRDGLSIRLALTHAESKAAGISPLLVAKILAEYDYSTVDGGVKWVTPFGSSEIREFLTNISKKIVQGKLSE